MKLQNANIAIASVVGISLLGLALYSSPRSADAPPVYDYRNLSVKQLVARLALPEQAKETASAEDTPQPTVHPRVAAAEKELLARGAKVVPQLVNFRDDPRVSRILKDATPYTVGEKVSGIIVQLMTPAVKLSVTPPSLQAKGRPQFGMYYNEVGPDKYNRWAWRSTPQQQELAFIRWYIGTTRSWFVGYETDDHVEQHLAPYVARATMLEQLGVETSGPFGTMKKRTGPSEH